MADPTKKQLNTTVDKDVYDAIETEANAQDRTVGKQVGRILREWVETKDAAPDAVQPPSPERAAEQF